MNDDFDSMNDLDSILAEFGGSAPQEEAPAAPAAAEEPTPQPVVEPEAQEEKADGNTHLWRSRDLTAAARPVRKPMPMRATCKWPTKPSTSARPRCSNPI